MELVPIMFQLLHSWSTVSVLIQNDGLYFKMLCCCFLQHNFRANLHLKGTIGLLVLVIDFIV